MLTDRGRTNMKHATITSAKESVSVASSVHNENCDNGTFTAQAISFPENHNPKLSFLFDFHLPLKHAFVVMLKYSY
jgi:hypothetical protein